MLPDWLGEFAWLVLALVVTLVVLSLLVFVPPLLYFFVFLPALPDWVVRAICDLSPCFVLGLAGFLATPLLAFGVGIAFLRRFEGSLPFPTWLCGADRVGLTGRAARDRRHGYGRPRARLRPRTRPGRAARTGTRSDGP